MTKLTGPQFHTLNAVSRSGVQSPPRFDPRVVRALRDFGYITQYPGETGYRLTNSGNSYLVKFGDSHLHKKPRKKPVYKPKTVDLNAGLLKVLGVEKTEPWILSTVRSMEMDIRNSTRGSAEAADKKQCYIRYWVRAETLLDYFRQVNGILVQQGVRKFFTRWQPV